MTLKELAEKFPLMFALYQHQEPKILRWLAENKDIETSAFLNNLADAKQEAIDLQQEGIKITAKAAMG